ncbi:HK97-gp10 family putative phage morphogenesis protein [Acinetobacter sp. YH01021]|uniref:HK97-gp10 family putative phage morphogenesis protein n=1 Tax=Acinetobacter sp. YH01021 TaxID=2601035 RepID=UPI0015D221CD|nr:HK97-gp10 family putative phage morphogenesis protein [Acinetobacter sp. YH01021]
MGIKGLEVVSRNLENIKLSEKNKQVRSSLRKAAKVIQNAAKENAKKIDDPETSEEIWKNIVVRAGKTQTKGEVKVRIGVQGGGEFWKINKNMERKGKGRVESPYYKPLPNDTRHFWLVEFGTMKTLAQPFLRPAFEANKEQAVQLAVDDIKATILAEIKT